MTPEIREAQLLSWQRTPNTAMAVTIDCGDANDIHPAHKQPVGARLALAARALAYGERLEYSGPGLRFVAIKGEQGVAALHPSGRRAGGEGRAAHGLHDRRRRQGLSSGQGRDSRRDRGGVGRRRAASGRGALRLGQRPEGNLFNPAGLPASPFRTDVE